MRLSFPLSVAIHTVLIGLLFLLPVVAPPPPKIDLSNAIAVVFAPAPSRPPPAALPQPPPPEPAIQPQPAELEPPPPPQVVEQPPPPPAPVAETPPPPPNPEPKPAPKPRPRPQPVQQAEQPLPEQQLPLPLRQPSQAPQMASIPTPAPPPPAAAISPDYRTLLSGWLESHKRYPEDARQRGEEGRAVLRFRVDRYGRVLDYAVVSSTGFADLDRSVEAMMRGATMPPFPPSMTMPEIEVSVTIRFGLSR